ncbi:MAG: hypothetical protein PHE02_10420 [Lachnospiraceae bacterium]|nr:hypothetical protein [Lachnospiraceae bacterium]
MNEKRMKAGNREICKVKKEYKDKKYKKEIQKRNTKKKYKKEI